MPKGGRFVTLFYPGRIAIPEHSAFPVTVDGKHATVLLYRHFNAVEALDFNNAIRREVRDGVNDWSLERPITMPAQDRIGLEANGQLIYVFENGVQYYRLFKPRAFTELFIQHDVEDPSNLTEEEKTRHVRVLERFILAYRTLTGDVTIRVPNDLVGDYPVERAGMREYTEEELQLTELDRLIRLPPVMDFRLEAMPLGINPALLTPPAVNPERVGPTMTQFLASGESIPEPQAILVKATEELKINQDYTYALLLGYFSIEHVLTEYLVDVKEKAGISKNIIKNYQGDIGMAYKINVELPLVVRADHPVRQILPDLNAANTLRNAVAHKGRQATMKEAASVIQTADKLIKALYTKEPIAAASPS
jgi:hypothetical protein